MMRGMLHNALETKCDGEELTWEVRMLGGKE